MDVNINAEVKGVGVATVPAVEREDRAKPQVTPVAKSTDSSSAALGEKELHRRGDKKDEKKSLALKPEELEKVVAEIQDRLDVMGTRLDISVNKEPNAFVVKVTDRTSGEIVKQFPSEEVLSLKKKLQELTGLIFDKTM
ncbi:MAG: flagellar protein FlaG [Desulfobulbaceae bacterium]|nr:flagellar protein FlaG [Desulfobulbaceae bacterium]HIJ79496.1 flagellar protein FlaG [Deltaproteobacteria bacterium]